MQGTCKWDANGSNGSAHFYFDIRLFFSRRGHVEPAPAVSMCLDKRSIHGKASERNALLLIPSDL